MKTAGIEICQAGWILVSFSESDSLHNILRDDDALASVFEEFDRIFIHIPIGLPDTSAYRECDQQARNKLGDIYADGVVDPPVRAALSAPTYAEANLQNLEHSGKELSVRAWQILPKIRSVDMLLQGHNLWIEKLFESYPELLFMRLNQGVIYQKNNTKRGVRHRLDLITRVIPDAKEMYRNIKEEYRRNEVDVDEIVNSMALAWAAHASETTDIASLPEDPKVDSLGLKMGIYYI